MHQKRRVISFERPAIIVIAIAVISAFFLIRNELHTSAAKSLASRTESRNAQLPDYDIRTDKNALETLSAFRQVSGKNASQVADIRDGFAAGENRLRGLVPTLKVDYNMDIVTPEVIGPDVRQGPAFLTGRSDKKRSEILVDFLRQNAQLTGVNDVALRGLKVFSDYSNPEDDLSFVELDQELNGIPVFRGEVKAGFTKNGELIRVINNLAPGLEEANLSTDFGDPLSAVKSAAGYIDADTSNLDLATDPSLTNDLRTTFGKGDSATTAEKMYFPTEPGVAVPAWRVLIWQPVNAFYVIVDAKSGTMLWRKNISDDQTQSATYRVYTNSNAMINVADSPFPLTPGPTTLNGQQGPALGAATISRIGNEMPYTFNNLGWITDGGTSTDGNAVQAGLDRDGTDGIDTNGEAQSPTRNFSFIYNPFSPISNTGDEPVPTTQTYPGSLYQQGSLTQLFYICNWYHDETYRLGFTEAFRNFQNDNFGRGGVAGDRIRAEGQDSSGTNNANFSTPADGTRGRMQMYLWTGTNPRIDGDLDASIVIHELTHGLSNRLHGNSTGLSLNMSKGLGEGWSDFYAAAMLSEPGDNLNGIYAVGGYDTYLSFAGFTTNNYYGIRRFPLAIKSFTAPNGGGPHNPLTFADVDQTTLNLNDGAFARGPYGSAAADEVHNLGEIWAVALWEVRAKMITRLGWSAGNRKALQLVTDGMKLAPLAPTFLSERDAILAAAQAGGIAADVADVWSGFAIRGMGYSASIQNVGSSNGDARVTEAFDSPNLYQTPSITVTDPAGNNNGFPEPGETVTLTIPITNWTGINATGVTLQVVGGGSANFGTIVSGTTATQTASYTVPFNATCGGTVNVTFNVNSSLGPTTFTRAITIGVLSVTSSENFDGVTAPNLPFRWFATTRYAPMTFVTVAGGAFSGTNSAFAADLPNCTSGCSPTAGGDTDMTMPAVFITAAAAQVSFRHKYLTEAGWDGGVLEISIGNGSFIDITDAGGTFLQNGYNGSLGVSPPNPLGGRNAWTGDSGAGDSGGYILTTVRLPPSAAGQLVQLRWRFGADSNGAPADGGWNIDSVQVTGTYTCAPAPASKVRADFDGDRRSDVSVFRPSDGNWYLNRSTSGFTGQQFGASDDILTPGDFDGDGKVDIAVFRPSSGVWYRLNSSNGQFAATQFGTSGDVPQAADFDGDGKADIAVWRPSSGTWFWINSSNGQVSGSQFGQNGDLPVTADYDGDGRSDIAVFRPAGGTWYRMNSGNGQFAAVSFGAGTDMPVPADYDGDGKADIAVFRPSDGVWYRLNSSSGQFAAVQFGANGDVPVPGDYDGDGKYDQAVYRSGVWYINNSTSGFSAVSFGAPSDMPVPKKYIP